LMYIGKCKIEYITSDEKGKQAAHLQPVRDRLSRHQAARKTTQDVRDSRAIRVQEGRLPQVLPSTFSQETEFKSGEDDLKTKDKDLQNKLTAFCQFLQENESKRKKAEERSRQEDKAYAEKE
jgi:hypothetical protein